MVDEQRAREERESYRQNFHNLNTLVGETSIQAVKMLFASNGGAIVALLGFLSFFVEDTDSEIAISVASSLPWFALGLVSSLIVSLTAYATNYCYISYLTEWQFYDDTPYPSETKAARIWNIIGRLFHVVSALAGLASLFFFVKGVLQISTVAAEFG
ncbi:MAG: hypothetical protein AAGJ34_03735 [Pseudomonadota bacterium]